MMKTKVPEETGWYWAKRLIDDSWCMAYVDVDMECLMAYGNGTSSRLSISIDCIDEDEWYWYGPINCPGSQFSDCTIIASEYLHQKATRDGRAICIQHVDYSHCDRATHTVTIISLRSMGDADTLVNRETSQAVRETTLVKLFRELDHELDGVAMTASAAAIANGIRSIIAELDDDE